MVLNPVPNHVPNHSQSLWAKHSEEKRFHCMTRNLRNAYPQCYELWSHYSERYPNLVVYQRYHLEFSSGTSPYHSLIITDSYLL